ncbi:MAG TPA: trypsin-like peptidase domain-containing protein [Patescibacteria group bacterium]|nr:trypsin-like peptidase domain-containing protein [Patescibacteria group bacterium]
MTPKKRFWIFISIVLAVSVVAGGVAGLGSAWYYASQLDSGDSGDREQRIEKERIIKKTSEESAVVSAVNKVSPAVVSIIITKEVPVLERLPGGLFGLPQYEQRGTQRQEVGGGSGFIVSSDGYVVTNRHVVSDPGAEYTVITSDQKKYQAEVKARDEVLDIAVLKIKGEEFPTVELGNSSDLQVGQTVIAIGNALGEFRNTVSTGVISGLSRSITAGGTTGEMERLSGMIQTDASINQGNSGGPLLNIDGQVIGINTAMASGAENIGFAIPVNEVKNSINDVREHGRIVRPWLGVRYIQLTEEIAQNNDLEIDYGALVVRGENISDLAVIPGSPADKAGLEANDIILEIEGQRINRDNPLAEVINQYDPGQKISLRVFHDGDRETREVKLEERKMQ